MSVFPTDLLEDCDDALLVQPSADVQVLSDGKWVNNDDLEGQRLTLQEEARSVALLLFQTRARTVTHSTTTADSASQWLSWTGLGA